MRSPLQITNTNSSRKMTAIIKCSLILDGFLKFAAQHGLVHASFFLLDQIEDYDGRSEPLQQFVEMFARHWGCEMCMRRIRNHALHTLQ